LKKILIVGQTPPPWGGQCIMIEKIINMKYDSIKIYHVRMFFSSEFDEVGKFKFKKVFHIFYIIAMIYYYRFKHNIKVLYYPPAGPNLIPVLRDIIILNSVRFLFEKTIFHFHAGGVSEYRTQIPSLLRILFDKAYNGVSVAIRLSHLNPEDGRKLKAIREEIIPLGIEDSYLSLKETVKKVKNQDVITILFVGVVMYQKGVEDLIRAVGLLQDIKEKIKVRIVGKAESLAFQNKLLQLVNDLNIDRCVEFCGVKTGNDKWQEYANADIFCFPTFFECETFGVVLLEAMSYKLPVISTYWRGVPSIVSDEETGLLVPINDIEKLSYAIRKLVIDEKARSSMGIRGRQRFLEFYTDEIFSKNMNNLFNSI